MYASVANSLCLSLCILNGRKILKIFVLTNYLFIKLESLEEFIFVIYFFVAFHHIKYGAPAFACDISIKYLLEIRR